VKFTVTGATAGATYYLSIKYSSQNMVGQTAQAVGGVYPTSIYLFATKLGDIDLVGSLASISVKPKK
jgi:hypothetical protein